MTRRVQVNRVYEIPCFRKSHNTLHLGGGGGLFALKQWISNSLKRDTVPRVNTLYCFYVKNPPNVLHYGIGKIVSGVYTKQVIFRLIFLRNWTFPANHKSCMRDYITHVIEKSHSYKSNLI